MAQKKQTKLDIETLGPKYGLGPVITKEQAFATFKKAASAAGVAIVPEEVMEREY